MSTSSIIKKWSLHDIFKYNFQCRLLCNIDDIYIACVYEGSSVYIFDTRLEPQDIIKERREICMWSFAISSLLYLGNNLLSVVIWKELFICDLTKKVN